MLLQQGPVAHTYGRRGRYVAQVYIFYSEGDAAVGLHATSTKVEFVFAYKGSSFRVQLRDRTITANKYGPSRRSP